MLFIITIPTQTTSTLPGSVEVQLSPTKVFINHLPATGKAFIMKRPIEPETGNIYHVYNKSIYGYIIFNTPAEYERMQQLISYYQWDMPLSFSGFKIYVLPRYPSFACGLEARRPIQARKRVDIIAYCLMPTHIHFVVRQLCDGGIAAFMKDIQSGYSQFFNRRHNRRGPLWERRFGNGGHLATPEKILEKITYVHNNPVKDLGYNKPTDWAYSSLTSTLPGSVEVTENPARVRNNNLCRRNSS